MFFCQDLSRSQTGTPPFRDPAVIAKEPCSTTEDQSVTNASSRTASCSAEYQSINPAERLQLSEASQGVRSVDLHLGHVRSHGTTSSHPGVRDSTLSCIDHRFPVPGSANAQYRGNSNPE